MDTSNKKSLVREYIEAILIALVLALFIRTFIVQAFKIPSGSMEPTLLIGDHLLVNKFIYGIKNPFTGETWVSISKPEHRDIIVFKYPVNPDQDFIKRVIGVEGDTVEMKDKKLLVNGDPFIVDRAVYRDPNIFPAEMQPRDNFGPITVPQGSLFVMGDNRDNSYDSRFWKFVKLSEVKGKAFILYWSWNSEWTFEISNLPIRFSRLFNLIH
ncbi:MAG: signal peptidase I [Desulfobulbaceae bacterium]|nr:signal peptidase I [Desulfobulbaceae bacterium]